METADYISMFWSAQEMGVQALMLYVTVTSGYLIVAYLVGAQLTRSQVLFVSALFVVFALYSLWGVTQYWTSGYLTDLAFKEHIPHEYIELNRVGLNPALISLPMGILGILGSVKFMWDLRKKGN